MNPGLMDRKITVESKSVVKDSTGGEVMTWSTFTTAWARVQFNDGGESVNADKIEAGYTTNFTIYYNTTTSQITNAMRILFEGNYYNIQSVAEIQRRELLKITTKINK